MLIGPSTGWWCAKISAQVSVHNRILCDSGACAAEMFLSGEDRRHAFLAGAWDPKLIRFSSLHFDSFESFHAELEGDQLQFFKDFAQLRKQYAIETTVLHPHTTPFHMYRVLRKHQIPIGIENMDRKKPQGTSVAEIECLLKQTGARGVLDLQHCYEIASVSKTPYLELVRQFAQMMIENGGISHLHVSGELYNGSQLHEHAPLTVATNRVEVLSALSELQSLCKEMPPIILEGDPLFDLPVLPRNTKLSEFEILSRSKRVTNELTKEIELIRLHLAEGSDALVANLS